MARDESCVEGLGGWGNGRREGGERRERDGVRGL